MTQPPEFTAPSGHPEAPAPCETLTVVLDGESHLLSPHADETVVETVFNAGLRPPVSCLMGSCATCIARITDGTVEMRRNDVLTEQEVAMGYVLTCQSVPTARAVTIVYEA